MRKATPFLLFAFFSLTLPSLSYALIATSLDYPVSEQEYQPGSYKGRSFFYEEPDPDHLGEDIDLIETTPIKAIGHGTIVWYYPQSDPSVGYGELVAVIEHDLGQEYNFTNGYGNTVTTRKILSIYGHIRKSLERDDPPLTWKVGDQIEKGKVIGYINDDAHNGDGEEHLHMGIRLSDKATAAANDPGKWFRGYEGDTDFGKDFASAQQVIQSHQSPPTSQPSWSASYTGQPKALSPTNDGGFVILATDGSVAKLSSSGSIDWQKRFEAGFSDIKSLADGSYLLAGSWRSGGIWGSSYRVLLKLKSDGTVDWYKAYGGGCSGGQALSSTEQTPNQETLVLGSTCWPGSTTKTLLLKLDKNGNSLWQKEFPDQYKFLVRIYPTSDGGFIGLGYAYSSAWAAGIIKFNSEGSIEWQKIYNVGYVVPTDVIKMSDNNFLFLCPNLLLKINGTNGSVIFQKILSSTNGSIRLKKVKSSGDGGYVVLGEIDGEAFALRFNDQNTLLWQRKYVGLSGIDIHQLPESGFIILGKNLSSETGEYIRVLKTDAFGLIDMSCDFVQETDITIQDTTIAVNDANFSVNDVSYPPSDKSIGIQPTTLSPTYICQGYGLTVGMPADFTTAQEIPSQIDANETHWWDFVGDKLQQLLIILGFDTQTTAQTNQVAMLNEEQSTTTFNIKIYKPDGTLYKETQSSVSPIQVQIPSAAPGQWRFEITAIEVPYPDDPYVLAIGTKDKVATNPAILQLLLN